MKPVINPTERPILPVIITGVIPMARKDMIVICLRRFEKLLEERKTPPVKEPKIIIKLSLF